MSKIPDTPEELSKDDYFDENLISFEYIKNVLLNRIWSILFIGFLSLVGGTIFIIKAKPRYTSSALILVDPRESNIMAVDNPTTRLDNEDVVVDSELELLRSNETLRQAILSSSFSVLEDKSFSRRIKEWIKAKLKSLDQNKTVAMTADTEKQIRDGKRIQAFLEGMEIERISPTYVLEVRYTSEIPENAKKWGNLVAQAYIDDKKNFRLDKVKQNNDWFKDRIDKLKVKVSQAYRNLEDYKIKYNIGDAQKAVISEQQEFSLQDRMITAKTKLHQVQMRYIRLKDAINRKGYNATVTGALRSPVISRLRSEYTDVIQRMGALRKYGKRHQAYRKVRAEAARIRSLIVEEMMRFLSSYRDDFLAAKIRLESLEKGAKELKTIYTLTSQKGVKFKELKGEADALKKHYNTLLATFRKSSEQETAPTIGTRIIQRASIPLYSSWPKRNLILALSLILGLSTGVLWAFLKAGVGSPSVSRPQS